MASSAAGGTLEASREAIRTWQMEGRPPGMPPENGLLYQPIPFRGYEDLPCERDSSEDRFQLLLRVLEPRGEHLLDLGCANGYFPFRFAQVAGALGGALGVDRFPGNVNTASHLAERYGLSDRLRFRQAEITEALLDEVLESPYTLVLLLSVHHHLIREQGIEGARRVFTRLHEAAATVVVEQGSLTQDEYEAWTGRREPFSTRAFSRLVSMAESAGIAAGRCFPIGLGRYASGRKADRRGSGRAIVGLSKRPRAGGVLSIRRKAHKNGVFMELLTLAGADGRPAEVWKNVVSGTPRSAREAAALRALAGEPGFVRLLDGDPVDEADGLLRLRYEPIAGIDQEAVARHGPSIRAQCLERLLTLAAHGIVHGELHGEHVMLRGDGRVLVLDFESARGAGEPFELWHEEVAADNPALGLGMYPRPEYERDWDAVDLAAMAKLLEGWGLAPPDDDERLRYRTLLEQARRPPR
ncbi:MAG: methyltransferase domain-containing protein [Holophagales bacterium]|nr:methyltransferase domain-containing protein [Holophagales bacterium]